MQAEGKEELSTLSVDMSENKDNSVHSNVDTRRLFSLLTDETEVFPFVFINTCI